MPAQGACAGHGAPCIVPDIVLFLNGLPVAVIECKSPKVKDAIPEAINQLLRYSEQRGAKGEGSAPLFYYNQIVIATCRQEAKFGTITTYGEKYFYRWADPYPRTVDDLAHGGSSPNDQQRLVAGMLDRDNLLDLIRTFTLFSTNNKGETIKIVRRYQQFRAVKLAVKRLLTGQNPRERSGIIWHTQGSGKSLTMMFMVREMYRHARLSHWKVVFVTDRTQLEVHRKKQMPLFRMFKREIFGVFFEQNGFQLPEGAPGKAERMTAEDKISRLVDLTQQSFLVVERELKLTGFWESIPARNKLRADIQNVLLAPEFSKLPGIIRNRAHIISRIMEIAEKNNDIILYAE
jgi:hypothetical protein